MVCHGELARKRPATRHLTEFYLLMSVGGVLGGVFNALIAPVVFSGIIEYPLAMVLACLLLPPLVRRNETGFNRRRLVLDLGLPVLIGLAVVVLGLPENDDRILGLIGKKLDDIGTSMRLAEGHLFAILVYGLPAVLCYTFVERPLRFGLSVAAIMLGAAYLETLSHPDSKEIYITLRKTRTFFGVLKVSSRGKKDGDVWYHYLYHGTTLHGQQDWEGGPKDEPLTYYHRSGPIGQVLAAYQG